MSIPSLKIIFAGTPAFAVAALQALIDSPHEVVAVYTQPDRPSGRGLKLTPSPVKTLALECHLPVHQPASLKSTEEQLTLASFNADVMVVAAYGLLLPEAVLRIPRLGCVNIHPSLLPRWRGAAPIQRTVYAGDTETGVTIMQMDVGLDTGPMLLQQKMQMAADETSQTLHDKLAQVGASALVETLDLLAEDKIHAIAQDNHYTTYANKISKEEALIDWEKPALELEREVRAFNQWPVSYTTWNDKNLRVWQAKAITNVKVTSPRTIMYASRDGIDIATSDGVLRLLQVQLPGGKVLSVADFYNAHRNELVVGEKLI